MAKFLIKNPEVETPSKASEKGTMLKCGERLELPACPAEIDFTGNGNSDPFLVSGFSGQEEWGRWTDGKVAEVACSLPKEAAKRPRKIKLYAAGYVGKAAKQQVEISINGKKAGAYSFSGQPSEVEVKIPKGKDSDLRITFDIKETAG
jgi:hypothetical protein